MLTLFIAILAGLGFLIAYHTYGRWLGRRIFGLSADTICPSERLNDGNDYVPTPKAVVFGHHFTSIAWTGPIVGPAIAVMWGWLPALLWVVFGSIFIGVVHDFGALVVSLRNNGQTVGDIAGRVINRRVRILFLVILFMALTVVLAIFGLVIASVFKKYPAAIFPCMVQIPIAVTIGVWLFRKGTGLFLPSILALIVMYLAVIYGNIGWLGTANTWMAAWPVWVWVVFLLVYSYIASVLPVWMLLQPRDYINSLQLVSALALIVIGLFVAAVIGGAPPVEGAERVPLEVVAPMIDLHPEGAPVFFPFLFITIACGAISGFHCLVSSGTSSKQLKHEPDARFVGYGAMLTEGFLATLVILACVAGLGLGARTTSDWQITRFSWSDDSIHEIWFAQSSNQSIEIQAPFEEDSGRTILYRDPSGSNQAIEPSVESRELLVFVTENTWFRIENVFDPMPLSVKATSEDAWNSRYASWSTAKGLGAKIGAFVDGAANFLKAMGIPAGIAIALMGVFVASFAGTTLDTACRLQRYVVQELARALLPRPPAKPCLSCGYDLFGNASGVCPECGTVISGTGGTGVPPVRNGEEEEKTYGRDARTTVLPGTPRKNGCVVGNRGEFLTLNPLTWLRNKHGATLFAVGIAATMAALPAPGAAWSLADTGKGGLILWPLFGATNQLLAGLSFLVVAFFLWRRGKPVWFLVLPMLFMLFMPMAAMVWNLFIGNDTNPAWITGDRWVLIVIGITTIALEVWMIIEAILLFPRVKGVLEEDAIENGHRNDGMPAGPC